MTDDFIDSKVEEIELMEEFYLKFDKGHKPEFQEHINTLKDYRHHTNGAKCATRVEIRYLYKELNNKLTPEQGSIIGKLIEKYNDLLEGLERKYPIQNREQGLNRFIGRYA